MKHSSRAKKLHWEKASERMSNKSSFSKNDEIGNAHKLYINNELSSVALSIALWNIFSLSQKQKKKN